MAAVNEDRMRAAERLQHELRTIAETVEHPSGTCMVTATPRGEIKALHLHPALLTQGAQAVGRVVTETVRLATDAAVQTSFNRMALALGDGMAIDVESITGDSPFRAARTPVPAPEAPADQAPPQRGRREPRPEDTDDDAYFENPLWMR